MKTLTLLTLACSALCANPSSWEAYKTKTLVHQAAQPGWCSAEKAEKMMNLIYDTHPQVCVEVGVFGGSSIYPTAAALRFLNEGGLVYAIDPWANPDCLVGYEEGDPNYNWWNSVNLEKIYQDFVRMLSHYRLSAYCEPLRMTGREALALFPDESIDILHIDGNHTEESAYFDVTFYLPKVKSGGYIWFDDVNWMVNGKFSTNKAVQYLFDNGVKEEARSIETCFLFRKN